MKNLKNIEALREKYWSGETTLEEEQLLKEYTLGHPDNNGPEQQYFAYLNQEKAITYTKEVALNQSRSRKLVMRLLPLAASFILLAGAIWTFNSNNSQAQNEVVIDDPQVALQITREAFALINGKVDRGEQAIIDNMAHLDKTFIFKNL